jgi:protein arginine N-methyltransferase 1
MNKVQNLVSGILRDFLRLGLRAVKATKKAIKSNKTISNLLYDFSNVDEFSDLYAHEHMLADSVRVDTYAAGIERHIKTGDVVVDLGTGTGILAILAARQGAKVYAIDHSKFIGVAEKVAQQNGVDTINFVKVHSKEFNCPEKVDILLHEQIGDCLFDENMVENLLDLKRRLLKDTGKILPGRFELFVEPIVLKEGTGVPFVWELAVQGVNYEFMRSLPELEAYKPSKYSFPYIETTNFDSFLATPQSILQVDLNEITDSQSVPTQFNVSRTVTQPGKMAGLCVYFRILFDDEILFSTAPDQPKTHWGTRMFRTGYTVYAAGDVISYELMMGSIQDPATWSVSIS